MSIFFGNSSTKQVSTQNASNHNNGNVGAGRTNSITHPHVQAPFNETGTVIGINGKFLHGFLCGVVAYWCWPSDPKWWGLYLYSVILWAASACFAFEGIRSFVKLRSAKKRWAYIRDLGARPKNAQIVDKTTLQNERMN